MLFNPHKYGLHRFLRYIPLQYALNIPYRRALQKAVNIADLRTIAKARANKMVFDYIDSGADDEITVRRNKDAYTEYEMHYQTLAGIDRTDLSTHIFGRRVQLPFFGCPTAGNRMFHWEGEVAAARAAQHHGTLYALSSLATTGIAEISAECSDELPKVFQLYVWKDRAILRDVLAKAKEGGYDALALTVDVSWMGNRERDLRNDFSIPPKYTLAQTWQALRKPAWTWDFVTHEPYTYACIDAEVPAESLVSFVNSKLSPDFGWRDAEWLLGEWNGPSAAKGVIRPDDAQRAVEIGFSTIWISNHGGRQLETSPATIDVLPSIRAAIGPDVPIIIDGGIQRGTDVCKALALGADAVGVGRPYLFGLAAGGTAGVIKAYDILKVELDRAMGLLGTPTIADLKRKGPSLVRRRQPSARDFPDVYAVDRGYGGGYY